MNAKNLFFTILVLTFISCESGKTPEEFAIEICDENSNGAPLKRIAVKVAKERKKHNSDWFIKYKSELKRLGCI